MTLDNNTTISDIRKILQVLKKHSNSKVVVKLLKEALDNDNNVSDLLAGDQERQNQTVSTSPSSNQEKSNYV